MEKSLPKHVAFIMDGNGRWAKKKLVSKKLGHKAGAEALNNLLKKIAKTEIKHVTVYAFSTENWKRSKQEVEDIMNLLREYFNNYISSNKKTNFKIDVIGDISYLDHDLQEKIKNLEDNSKNNQGLNLHIALNYGGRDEIVRALKKIAIKIKNNQINIDGITEDLFAKHLDTSNCPDPELIVRTSGEFRISNFLLWQSAYSEFYFCDKLWPDFTFNDLEIALNKYLNRERRFGGRNEGK